MPLTGPCPADPEETAEAYVMRRLTQAEAEAYENHYVACEACVTLLQQAALIVQGITAAGRELQSKTRAKL